ncbi:MAG: type II secretion system F family protein [Candidatus Omnitrophota bacterium]
MSKFIYKARDKSGQIVEGVLDLPTKRAVLEHLSKNNYFPTQIIQQRSSDLINRLCIRFKGTRLADTILFSRQLATMLRAGLNPTRSLNVLAHQTHSKPLKKAVLQIQADITAGNGLADALAQHPNIFSELYVNNVRVGEEGGNLEEVLKRLASYAQSQKELKERIKSALIYPITVLIVSMGVIAFLVTFVLPKFATVFERVHVPLPALTKWLFNTSRFVMAKWPLIVIGIMSFISAAVMFIQTSSGRYIFDKIKLKLPIFGELVRKVAILRFARSLEILIRNGVNIVRSFEITSRATGNVIINEALENVCLALRKGGTISKPLKDSKEFPLMVTEMIEVGEETGDLEEMLTEIAESFEEDVDRSTKNLTTLIEPILLVFLAGIVAVVALSLFLPMFKMIGVLEG